MSFGFKVKADKNVCTISFLGEIDESSNFQKIDLPEVSHLIIDLKDLRLLNSVGLRSWVLWIRSLKCPVITIRNCPSVAVHQVNVLEGFLPHQAVLESFALPYHCDTCGQEDLRWAERGVNFMERTADKAEWVKYDETIPCSSCGKDSAIDVMPLRYFSFLRSRR